MKEVRFRKYPQKHKWENKKDIDSGLDMPTVRERSDIKEVGEKEG